MSVELITFVFQSIFIRVLLIEDTIWFIASDIAKALGYKKPRNAITMHCKRAKSLIDIDALIYAVQENQEVRALDPKTKLIPEIDVYKLTTKSTFESAEPFENWIFDTVIPKIHKRNQKAPTTVPDNIVTYDGIQFLRYEEEYEVRKGKIDTLAFYTKRDSGESGMSVKSLANGCGIALKSLQELLEEKNIEFFLEGTGKQGNSSADSLVSKAKMGTGKPADFYLIKTPAIHVVLDIYCERVFRYYAYESRYKKTKAKELYIAYTQHGMRDSMQVKTQYDPQWALFHNKSTLETIDEKFKNRISELELKLVEKDTQLEEQEQTITKLTQEIKILKFVSNDEEAYRSLVHAMVGGEREVYIGGIYPGRVDIVTDNMIIEVKRTEEFEKGFGQLRRYCAKLAKTKHANKLCTLVLYGKITFEERNVLQNIACDTKIQLIFIQDIRDYINQNELDLLKQSV